MPHEYGGGLAQIINPMLIFRRGGQLALVMNAKIAH
jgi:hypothetical protein